MPIHDIQTKEYECSWCGYKWINRFNGKDGPTPSKCAKCKRTKWDKGQQDIITPTESGLRKRIKGLSNLYQYNGDADIFFPKELSDKFLAIQPRPTLQELIMVLFPLGVDIRETRRYLPPHDNPGQSKYYHGMYIKDPKNPEKWVRISKQKGGLIL